MFSHLREKVKELIIANQHKIIKIDESYEINADLSNEIMDLIITEAEKEGWSVIENLKVHHVTEKRIIVSKSITFKRGETIITREAIGEAWALSNKADIMARTAETRAYKRLAELILGKNIINEIIMSISKEENSKEKMEDEENIGKTTNKEQKEETEKEIEEDLFKYDTTLPEKHKQELEFEDLLMQEELSRPEENKSPTQEQLNIINYAYENKLIDNKDIKYLKSIGKIRPDAVRKTLTYSEAVEIIKYLEKKYPNFNEIFSIK
ncbi:MAG: hypothetical protein QXX30_00915 [Candidatus Aenigmatarchaeota archaeon]